MRKYWIIENGKPVGPFTINELKVRRDFKASLPVWYSGLPEWTTVGELAELSILLPIEEVEEEKSVMTESTIQIEEIQEKQPIEEQPQQKIKSNFGYSASWINAQPAYQASTVNREKQPSNYIAWNIFMVFCCCMPVAMLGIIFGSMVNKKWMNGDIEGAKKYSEYAAWCVILSFTLSIVFWPFQLVMSML